MKKGLEPIMWAFVTITLTLVIVVFAVNPLQAAIDEAISQNAELTAQEIRTAINIIQTMPSVSEHTINLKTKKCKININEDGVSVEIKNINATLGVIKTDYSIEKKHIDCSQTDKIILKRIENNIEIT